MRVTIAKTYILSALTVNLIGGSAMPLAFASAPNSQPYQEQRQITASGSEMRRNPAISPFPSPGNLIKNFDMAGSMLEESILKYLRISCVDGASRHSFCDLPTKLEDYKKDLRFIYSEESPVHLEIKEQLKPWDLRQLLAGNFLVLPSDQDIDPMDLIINIFEKRHGIIRTIADFNNYTKNLSRNSNPTKELMVPAMRAHILAGTTLGASIELFESLQCQFESRYCEFLKERLGGLISFALEGLEDPFLRLRRSMDAFLQQHEVERHRRLAKIVDFVTVANHQDSFNRNTARAALEALNEQDQGAFYDSNYYSLTAEIVAVSEALHLYSFSSRLTPYTSEGLRAELGGEIEATREVFRQSLQNIEGALNIYGFGIEPKEEM